MSSCGFLSRNDVEDRGAPARAGEKLRRQGRIVEVAESGGDIGRRVVEERVPRTPAEQRVRTVVADILRAHAYEHLERIRAMSPTEGFEYLDPDTVMSPGSLEAALRALPCGLDLFFRHYTPSGKILCLTLVFGIVIPMTHPARLESRLKIAIKTFQGDNGLFRGGHFYRKIEKQAFGVHK